MVPTPTERTALVNRETERTTGNASPNMEECRNMNKSMLLKNINNQHLNSHSQMLTRSHSRSRNFGMKDHNKKVSDTKAKIKFNFDSGQKNLSR